MKTMATLLLKVLVKQFYIINTGFFLFIFFFFFGMVNGGQLISYHRSLITGMISSPVFMAVVLVAWLLYNLKCILFSTVAITNDDNGYLHVLKAVPSSKQLILYLLVCTMQYLPVLAYSGFIIFMATSRSMFLTAALVIVFQSLMIVSGAAVIFLTINKNTISPVVEKLMSRITFWTRVKKGYYAFLWGHLLKEKKIAIVVVKIFSILLLSVSLVRNGDHFDEDLFGIFFQLIFAAHAILVFHCVDFVETWMQFSRNLPIPIYKVAGMYLFTYGILMLPDLAFMLINNNGNLPVTGLIILYGTAVSTLFLYTALLYACGHNMESYMLFVFVIFIMIFFLEKTGFQLLTMCAVCLTAMAVFRASYYSFEKESI